MYLHDDRPICKVLAIDLCSGGFNIWQSYVDVMGLLRSLFNLATHTKKDGITTLNVGVAARSAVLQITSSNTPLVMTTLSMDILHVTDVQQRKSLMQMLAFLIRKVNLMISERSITLNSNSFSASVGDSTESSAVDRSGGQIPRSKCCRGPRGYHRCCHRDSHARRPNVSLFISMPSMIGPGEPLSSTASQLSTST